METNKLNFAQARELASAALIFTTHTPVEAGHDYFPPDLMDRYFVEYVPKLGLSPQEFLALGRRNPADQEEPFCMTVLALRMAAFSNGVSKLHGKVSRKLWRSVWPGVPEDEIPIGRVTNGVHFRSWISQEMNELYDRYVGPAWRDHPADQSAWRKVDSIPAEELWRTHERRRERMVSFVRRRLLAQLRNRGVSDPEIKAAEEVLSPWALTIGFARRFATYKRATLLLRDKERLGRILSNPDRPVQLIFAGKAHPRDEAGKELIRQVAMLAREPAFRRHLVFLENYDMAISRYLVQGVDVWLNTPLRPNEASGTSGMKAAANGVLNLSTLDGWWDEACQEHNGEFCPIGWAIGAGETYADREYQDQVEAEALYHLLEREVVPTFYDRRADGLPRRWISLMKSSIEQLCYRFNTHRMVREYTEKFYLTAHLNHLQLHANEAARARSLAEAMSRIRSAWSKVGITIMDSTLPPEVAVGEKLRCRARVEAGPLPPDDLAVELYMGRVNADGEIVEATAVEMKPLGREGGTYLYEAEVVTSTGSGKHGYTARVLPRNTDLRNRFVPGLIAWAK